MAANTVTPIHRTHPYMIVCRDNQGRKTATAHAKTLKAATEIVESFLFGKNDAVSVYLGRRIGDLGYGEIRTYSK